MKFDPVELGSLCDELTAVKLADAIRHVKIGEQLLAAKSELAHGKLGKLIGALPFGRTTAWNYMKLAKKEKK